MTASIIAMSQPKLSPTMTKTGINTEIILDKMLLKNGFIVDIILKLYYGKKLNMNIKISEYRSENAKEAMQIWNEVVKDGNAFPQKECLSTQNADEFFKSQTYTGIAIDKDTENLVGLYILHPNNVGHCAHIANASYAVKKNLRGEHIGEKLVTHCLETAHEKGFKILQFNAVVASNIHAIHLYERLGFKKIGKVPAGFLLPDGNYEDILLFYHEV